MISYFTFMARPAPAVFASLFLLAIACSEQEYILGEAVPAQPVGELAIRGQICDAERQVWLEGALVYTHLYDEDGIVFSTLTDDTDAEGRYELLGLAGGYSYEIYVQKGQQILEQFTVAVPADADLEVPPPACFGDVDLTVAVITGAYDEMETVLDTLGIAGFREIDGQAGDEITDFLTDPANLAEYQIVFFDGGHQEEGIVWGTGPEVATIQQNLKDYVQNGGVLYVTDWAYDVVEQIWPTKIEFLGDDLVPDAAQNGEPELIVAELVDNGLVDELGLTEVPLDYDISEWPVIEDTSEKVYLKGDVSYRIGMEVFSLNNAPLLVEFEAGKGRVIVSTFRNSVNGSNEALLVLGAIIGSVD